MSRANSVTLAREGSSAETCQRKEPPDKGPTPSSQSGSSGAGWGSSAHPHDSLPPPMDPAPSGVPLTTETEAFLTTYQSPRPDAELDFWLHRLPQTAGQLLSMSLSSSESLHHHTDAREEAGTFCEGESPTKASPR